MLGKREMNSTESNFGLVITKLDVLRHSSGKIQVCVGYKYKGPAVKKGNAPARWAKKYERVTPEYKTVTVE